MKAHLIPPEVTPAQAAITYASEADVLNVALFGQTAKQWRDANPKLEGNMRDHATIEQLLVLANIEGMNAEFIHMALPQGDRLKRLNQIAIRRREGRRLRGLAAKERRGRERRRGPVLHAAPAHRGDGGCDGARNRARRFAIRPAARAGSCWRRMITSPRTPGLDRAQKKRLKSGTLFGIELVDSVTRLCAMNLLLHGIGGEIGRCRVCPCLPSSPRMPWPGSMASTTWCWPIRRSARRAA